MVYRVDSGTWNEVDIKTAKREGSLIDVQAFDDNHAYAITDQALFSYNEEWTQVFNPGEAFERNEIIESFNILDPQHIWVISRSYEEDYESTYHIYFYNGHSYETQLEFESDCSILPISTNEVWAWSGSDIFFFDGSNWSNQYHADSKIRMIKARGKSAWAIGDPDIYGLTNSRIYFFDGTEWQKKGDVSASLTCFQLGTDSVLWAGGMRDFVDPDKTTHSEAFVFKFDADSSDFDSDKKGQALFSLWDWLPQIKLQKNFGKSDAKEGTALPEGQKIMDLAVIDSNDAWCITVNKDGSSSLLRFDGESWNKVESAETTYAPQSSIYALDSSHIWVTRLLEDSPRNNGLGCPQGVIEFYNGVELTKQFEIDERIVSIAMPSRTRLWACTPDKMFTTELQE